MRRLIRTNIAISISRFGSTLINKRPNLTIKQPSLGTFEITGRFENGKKHSVITVGDHTLFIENYAREGLTSGFIGGDSPFETISMYKNYKSYDVTTDGQLSSYRIREKFPMINKSAVSDMPCCVDEFVKSESEKQIMQNSYSTSQQLAVTSTKVNEFEMKILERVKDGFVMLFSLNYYGWIVNMKFVDFSKK